MWQHSIFPAAVLDSDIIRFMLYRATRFACRNWSNPIEDLELSLEPGLDLNAEHFSSESARSVFLAKIVSDKISSQSMTQLTLARILISRASIIVAALFSLCISSNVGPRFLPLPPVEKYAAENLQPATAASASRLYSRGASFRVPMAQAQKRADRELQAQSLAVIPGIQLVLSNNTKVFAEPSDPQSFFSVVLALLPSGRAPPRLV